MDLEGGGDIVWVLGEEISLDFLCSLVLSGISISGRCEFLLRLSSYLNFEIFLIKCSPGKYLCEAAVAYDLFWLSLHSYYYLISNEFY